MTGTEPIRVIVAGAAAVVGTGLDEHWKQIEGRFAADRLDLRG